MLTFEQIIRNIQDFKVIRDGQEYNVDIKEELLEMLKSSYSSPSLVIGKDAPLDRLMEKDIWIIANTSEPIEYMNEKCDTLIFAIKPKYDFLMIYKKFEGNICDKVPMVNLSGKTNNLYNYLMDKTKK